MVIFFYLQLLLPLPAMADDSFPTAAAPLFLVLDNFHEQTNELLHLPCVREEGYEALSTLANRTASLQTNAAKETDSFLNEMQKVDPSTGDSCGGSFTSLVISLDGKRTRTRAASEQWGQIGKQLEQTTSALLPLKTIRYASSKEAGGGGGAKCVRKAKQLRKFMTAGAELMTTQFKAVEDSLESTGEQLAIYREQNARLAAGCGHSVAPDPYPAQTAHAHLSGRVFAAAKAGGTASDITGVKKESGLQVTGTASAPSFDAKQVSALKAAMDVAPTADQSAEALAGFSAEDKLKADAKHGLEGAVSESTDTRTTGAFQSLRDIFREEAREIGSSSKEAANHRSPASVSSQDGVATSVENAGRDLFQRVHACYERKNGF